MVERVAVLFDESHDGFCHALICAPDSCGDFRRLPDRGMVREFVEFPVWAW
jgi:hypothetical protein